MKRNVIIVDRNLSIGQVGNVAAILMGQIVKLDPTTFSDDQVKDQDGVQHAGIKNSTVLLKAGVGQITTLAEQLKENDEVVSVVFSAKGQSLNNRFDEYEQFIEAGHLADAQPVGIGLSGDDELIHSLTKKFSILK